MSKRNTRKPKVLKATPGNAEVPTVPQAIIPDPKGLCKTCASSAVCIFRVYTINQETQLVSLSIERGLVSADGPYCEVEVVNCEGFSVGN